MPWLPTILSWLVMPLATFLAVEVHQYSSMCLIVLASAKAQPFPACFNMTVDFGSVAIESEICPYNQAYSFEEGMAVCRERGPSFTLLTAQWPNEVQERLDEAQDEESTYMIGMQSCSGGCCWTGGRFAHQRFLKSDWTSEPLSLSIPGRLNNISFENATDSGQYSDMNAGYFDIGVPAFKGARVKFVLPGEIDGIQVLCERYYCSQTLDCVEHNTVAAHGYYPNCTCTCKSDATGPLCQYLVVDQGPYTSHYALLSQVQVSDLQNSTEAELNEFEKKCASSLGAEWHLASIPTGYAMDQISTIGALFPSDSLFDYTAIIGSYKMDNGDWIWHSGRLSSLSHTDKGTGPLKYSYNGYTFGNVYWNDTCKGNEGSLLSVRSDWCPEKSVTGGRIGPRNVLCERTLCGPVDCLYRADSVTGYFPNCDCTCVAAKCDIILLNVSNGYFTSDYQFTKIGSDCDSLNVADQVIWQPASVPTSEVQTHINGHKTDHLYLQLGAWYTGSDWQWSGGRLKRQRFMTSQSVCTPYGIGQINSLRSRAPSLSKYEYCREENVPQDRGFAIQATTLNWMLLMTHSGDWRQTDTPGKHSVLCERSPCSIDIDCYSDNTVGIDGGYYPYCHCQCKNGTWGTRCEFPLIVTHPENSYVSEYQIYDLRGSIADIDKAKSVCRGQGEGWYLATTPSTLSYQSLLVAAVETTWYGIDRGGWLDGRLDGYSRCNPSFYPKQIDGQPTATMPVGFDGCILPTLTDYDPIMLVVYDDQSSAVACERTRCFAKFDCPLGIALGNVSAIAYWPNCACYCRDCGGSSTTASSSRTSTASITSGSPTSNNSESRSPTHTSTANTASASNSESRSPTHTSTANTASASPTLSTATPTKFDHCPPWLEECLSQSTVRTNSESIPAAAESEAVIPMSVPPSTTAALSIAASAVGGAAAAADAQTIAIMGLVSCSTKGTQYAVENTNYKALTVVALNGSCEGVLFGNSITVAVVAFLSAVVVGAARIVLTRRYRTERLARRLRKADAKNEKEDEKSHPPLEAPTLKDACALARAPQMLLSVCVYLMNSYIVCGLRIARERPGHEEPSSVNQFAGAMAFLFPVFVACSFPILTILFGSRRLLPVRYEWRPKVLSLSGGFIFQSWALDPSVGSDKAFGCVFGGYRRLHPAWSLAPHLSFISVLPLALATERSGTCGPLFALSAAINFIGSMGIVLIRPRRVAAADFLHAATLFVNGLAVTHAAVLLYHPDETNSQASTTTLEHIGVAITVLSVLRIAQSIGPIILGVLLQRGIIGGVFVDHPMVEQAKVHDTLSLEDSDFELAFLGSPSGEPEDPSPTIKAAMAKTTLDHGGCLPDLPFLREIRLEYNSLWWPICPPNSSRYLSGMHGGDMLSVLLNGLAGYQAPLVVANITSAPMVYPTVAELDGESTVVISNIVPDELDALPAHSDKEEVDTHVDTQPSVPSFLSQRMQGYARHQQGEDTTSSPYEYGDTFLSEEDKFRRDIARDCALKQFGEFIAQRR